MRAYLGHGPRHDIKGIDIRRSFPQHTEMGIADQAGVDPIFDVAIAAANFHRTGRDFDIVACRAELDKRSQVSAPAVSASEFRPHRQDGAARQ